MQSRIKRRIQVHKNLHFEYEVSPHRVILSRISKVSAIDVSGVTSSPQLAAPPTGTKAPVGMHIPFRQVRLKGQVNPLKPPLHVETVLIGRALEQHTGYLLGVGFRIRDDGYVEGEFVEGVEKFTSFEKFREEVSCRMANPST
jgi:hypothetical protein